MSIFLYLFCANNQFVFPLTFGRFDLIFLMLDPQDELYDKRLARHLVSLYYSASEETESEFMVTKSIGCCKFEVVFLFELSFRSKATGSASRLHCLRQGARQSCSERRCYCPTG